MSWGSGAEGRPAAERPGVQALRQPRSVCGTAQRRQAAQLGSGQHRRAAAHRRGRWTEARPGMANGPPTSRDSGKRAQPCPDPLGAGRAGPLWLHRPLDHASGCSRAPQRGL